MHDAATIEGDPSDHFETLSSKLQGAIYLSNNLSKFPNSFFLERPIKSKGCEQNFLCLVTKNLGKECLLTFKLSHPLSPPRPLRKSRTLTCWGQPHFNILRKPEMCYTSRAQILQSELDFKHNIKF